ncbi:MAG: Biopolymer transport protein ExbB [Pseudomonadota bacterium]|jgi:biopolymer transport protein ExbB
MTISSLIKRATQVLAVSATTFAYGLAMAQTASPAPAAATPAAPAAAPAAAAPAATSESGKNSMAAIVDKKPENPYGLKALWNESDYVAKVTLIILVIMSVGSWYVIVSKLLEQSKMNSQADEAQKKFWSANSVSEGAAQLAAASPYKFLADSGIEATKKHTGLMGNVDLNTWVTSSIQRAIDNVQSRTQDGLAFLATVGSTAPFVGLFGTVWGIYNALVKIGTTGQASIDKVAGPVGESLIMTAIGLAVAVPAVLGYNWLVRRNKAAMDRVRAFGSDLYAVLLAGNKR